MTPYINKKTRRLWSNSLAILLCLCFMTSRGLSQETTGITATTGLGDLGTTVTSHGHRLQITGGTRPGNGTSLFHSFDQFNVGSGDTAQFLNTTPTIPTVNILSRVTGGSPSSIFGAIDSTSYPGANLFLMNPAGIVFGPTATLNVGGSVTLTTADYLRLAAGTGSHSGIFHAAPTETSLLTSAPVTAFGFLHSNPAAIAVQGSTLTVQPGESISLIGGNQGFAYINPNTGASASASDGITITDGHLVAAGGQVHIASVASKGELQAKTLLETGSANSQNFEAFGPIQISQQSSLDTSGETGGFIRIRGGHLVIDSSTLSSPTGGISLESGSMHITNAAEVMTKTTTAANAGHVSLKAKGDITLDSRARIHSGSAGSSGHAGNIILQSHQGDINLAGSASVTTFSLTGSGNTGSITLDAPHGDIHLNDTFVYTSGQGTGTVGGIQISANNLLMQNGAFITGNNFTSQITEPITIRLNQRLTMTGQSIIETAPPGSANAAELIVRSRDVTLTEHSKLITSTISSGDAGRLSLFTDTLQLTNGAQLLSGSLDVPGSGQIPVGRGGAISIEGFTNPGATVRIDGRESGIVTETHGSGAAGDIFVRASSLVIENGGSISAKTTGTSHAANGGSIVIQATEHVSLNHRASITASSTGNTAGDAGNIILNAGQQLVVRDNSSITTATESTQTNGGNIEIRAIDRVRLINASEISTSVKGAAGSGGNIFIDPKLVLLQGSHVTAQADGGAGGNITFVTPLFLADSASLVSASSARGPSGTVTIQSPTANLSGTVGQLASKTSPPQVLLQNRCIASTPGAQSTFILAGRDSLPAEPGGWLSSPDTMNPTTEEGTEHATGLSAKHLRSKSSSLSMAQVSEDKVLSLRRLTPPGFLVRTFATPSSGCSS